MQLTCIISDYLIIIRTNRVEAETRLNQTKQVTSKKMRRGIFCDLRYSQRSLYANMVVLNRLFVTTANLPHELFLNLDIRSIYSVTLHYDSFHFILTTKNIFFYQIELLLFFYICVTKLFKQFMCNRVVQNMETVKFKASTL